MTNLNDSEVLLLLKKWADCHAKINRLSDCVKSVFGSQPESLFSDGVWCIFEQYTEALSLLIGDAGAPRNESWLQWYWLENGMGDKGLQAGYNGQLHDIDTLDQLWVLIKQGRDA
jgi:hypothetical protein